MNTDPYLYSNAKVLRNKLGIRDRERLRSLECDLVALRVLELQYRPVLGCFDLHHLQAIHAYLFQDLYDWAGEIRVIDIAKDDLFCRYFAIEDEARRIFNELEAENYLQGLPIGTFVERLAYYFAEVNALHPFREGNGRTQREFFRSLAYQNNYFLSYADITAKEMVDASKKSLRKDYRALESLLLAHLRPL